MTEVHKDVNVLPMIETVPIFFSGREPINVTRVWILLFLIIETLGVFIFTDATWDVVADENFSILATKL